MQRRLEQQIRSWLDAGAGHLLLMRGVRARRPSPRRGKGFRAWWKASGQPLVYLGFLVLEEEQAKQWRTSGQKVRHRRRGYGSNSVWGIRATLQRELNSASLNDERVGVDIGAVYRG